MLKRLLIVVALVAVTACSKGRKIGDKVEVMWKGSPYPATIIETYENDKYKIHYDGYGDEWDEVVGMDRVLVKK